MSWAIGIDMYTLMCIKLMTNKNLLYKKLINFKKTPQLVSLHCKAHMPQLLRPRATATEACVPRAHAPQQEKPLQWEAHELQWSSPCSLQLEKARAQQQRPNAAKNK